MSSKDILARQANNGRVEPNMRHYSANGQLIANDPTADLFSFKSFGQFCLASTNVK